MKKVYVSYLNIPFDKKLLKPSDKMNNNIVNKPIGGFWASPEDAKYGWKEFYEDVFMEDRLKDKFKNMIKFRFTLSDDARIITIDDIQDINDKLKFNKFSCGNNLYIDFDSMRNDYDGIELTDPMLGHYFLNPKQYPELSKKEECFYCWDCESIVIWNPDIIIPLE